MGGNSSTLSTSQELSRARLLSSSSDSPASPTLTDSPLQCLRPYLLSGIEDRRREVGHGSYAVVKELSVLGKKVAGKRLHESLFQSASQERREEMLVRFARECKLLQSVKHPNIVRFLGVYLEETSHLPYLVMEYVDITLANYLQKHGVPEATVYYNILSDTVLGLRYMHHQTPPIIHRDLSANNILLSSSMQAKISDLGVAKVLDISPTEKTHITQTQAPGTDSYMPPEALVNRPTYDTSIDVFSYGVLIIQTLSSDWPIPTAATRIDPENAESVLPVTEFERRNHYITKIGLDHPAIPLIRKCLHNSASNRPTINTVVMEIMELQMKSDPGTAYHPQVSYEAVSVGELSVGIGDSLRVFGNGRKLLKTYSLTSSEVGYVPAKVVRQIQHCPMATALYTCTADCTDSMSLTKGDSLHLLSTTNPDWWYAECRERGKAGFIPSNYVAENVDSYRWYLGNTSHAEADSLLKQDKNVTGSFLVHDESQDIRCLTVRGHDSIMHYKIERKDKSVYIVQDTVFKTLMDLVHHYSMHSGVLCSILKHPYHVPRGDDEIDRSLVKFSHKMCMGKFGEVWKGLKGTKHVIVKFLTPGATSAAAFLKEPTLLAQLDHPKIIKCEGVCTKEEPIFMLMEFLKYGSLQEYLQRGEGRDIDMMDLVHLAAQIASGMSYLEHQQYIHCDLQARSVVVGEGRVCKIKHFHNARRVSSVTLPPKTSVPIRWTAPEVFATNEYTIKADVWSFGVVLHEIVTRGERPYNKMTNEQTLKAVQSGYRMPQPSNCPQGLYELMSKCWQTEPHDRLSFDAIESQLEEFHTSKCFNDRAYIRIPMSEQTMALQKHRLAALF